MIKLEKKDFYKIRELFIDAMNYHLAINSVIENETEGEIYVNCDQNPTFCLLWEKEEESQIYVGGKLSEEHAIDLNELIFSIISNEKVNNNFVMYLDNEIEGNANNLIFRELEPLQIKRVSYKIFKNKDFIKRALPKGIEVHLVTDNFLKRNYQNMEEMIEWIYKKSNIPFIQENGYGMCLVHEETNSILSWSCFDYVEENRAEIGVETSESFQRNGYAALLINQVSNYLFSKGIEEIGWHTDEYNIGSIKTAEKAGFKFIKEFPVYILEFNTFDNVAFQAYVYMDELQNYKLSAQKYERCIQMIEQNHNDYQASQWIIESGLTLNHFVINAAICNGKIKEEQKVDENLKKLDYSLIKNGQKFYDWVSSIEALQNYHETNDWKEMEKQLFRLGGEV